MKIKKNLYIVCENTLWLIKVTRRILNLWLFKSVKKVKQSKKKEYIAITNTNWIDIGVYQYDEVDIDQLISKSNAWKVKLTEIWQESST